MRIFVLTQAIPEYDCYKSSSPYDSGYYVMGAYSTYDLAQEAKDRLERINDGYDYFQVHSVHIDDLQSIHLAEDEYERATGDTE